MSSHCNRYPSCGCSSSVGTKCQLPEGDTRLLEKEVEVDNRNPWEELKNEIEKYELKKWAKAGKGNFKKVRKKITNIVPNKLKRKNNKKTHR